MLRTRAPLTPKGPFDLHVLSLPPAFVLSQDQTLMFESINLKESLVLKYKIFKDLLACIIIFNITFADLVTSEEVTVRQ